jgi:hypothetical protein
VTGVPADRLEAARSEVERFCGDCHRTPQPDSFPREQWPHEVDRGYEFYLRSGRTDLRTPPRSEILAYYMHHSPLRLQIDVAGEQAQGASRFQRVAWSYPKRSTDLVAIAHIQTQAAGSDGAELILSDMYGGAVSWARREGDRFRVAREAQLANPAHVFPTDLDGDGQVDFLVSDLGSFLPEDHDRGRLVWLRPKSDDPSAEFESIVLLEGVGRVADARAADFDGDGDLDIVVAVFGWHQSGGILLLRQTGRTGERLQFARETLDERDGAIHVPIADLNGDGRPDFVALIAQEYEMVEAFLSRGDGTFDKQVLYQAPDPSYGSSGIELVDLDGDGDLDVLYTNGDTFDGYYVKPYHGVRWIEQVSPTDWREHLLARLPGAHRALAADLDGDGDLDIAACAFVAAKARERQPEIKHLPSLIWLERRGREFHAHVLETDRVEHACLAIADVNGDGALDLVVGNFATAKGEHTEPISIWLNRGRND